MSNQQLPRIPKELVYSLSQRFPHRCPSPDDTEREIWMAAGRRQVVDFLLHQYDQQQKPENAANVSAVPQNLKTSTLA